MHTIQANEIHHNTPKIGQHFFVFRQNNSGGYFFVDDTVGIGQNVIIEAENHRQAVDKMQDLLNAAGEESEYYCECCGERWDFDWQVGAYSRLDEDNVWWYEKDPSFIHYSDGVIVRVEAP